MSVDIPELALQFYITNCLGGAKRVLNKKYILLFFGFAFFILSGLCFLLVTFAKEKSINYLDIFFICFFIIFFSFFIAIFFEGNGHIRLRFLRVGIYTANKYWIDENNNVLIVCCRGWEFKSYLSRIVWVKENDFVDDDPSEFFGNLESGVPVNFFVTKTKKDKKSKLRIYSLYSVLDINEFQNFILS